MPRPGPRPYECVRRAWHSDRHRPMRGSLIQEIFRVVNEIHSPATKKNKEWQEKLPVVVLKAEEIMYSKANSEAEYMDLKTLWERTNDAINTIIRRDETTETGDLLQPCIEAALNLGCTPRRASRSQRHNNPSCYLSSSTRGTNETVGTPKVTDNRTYEGTSNLLLPQSRTSVLNSSPQVTSYYSTLLTPAAVASAGLHLESTISGVQHRPVPHEHANLLPVTCVEVPVFSENFHPTSQNKSSSAMETYPWPTSGRIYPLHYNTNHRPFVSRFMCQNSQDSDSNAYTTGAPSVHPIMERKTSFLQNLLGCDNLRDSSTSTQQPSKFVGMSESAHKGYDLSLRLGLLPTPTLSTENNLSLEVEEAKSSISRDGSRYSDISPCTMRTTHIGCSPSYSQREKGFSFFPVDTGDNPLESGTSKWSSEGEGLNVEESARKRKSPISSPIDDRQFCWQPRPSTSQFFCRRKEPSS